MLDKMKIRTKLLVSFFIVALMAGFIGIFGIMRMKVLDKADTALFESSTLPLGYCTDMATAFQRIRVSVKDMILAETPEDFKTKTEQGISLSKTFDEEAGKYEKAIDNDVDKKNYDDLVKAKSVYMKYFNDYQKLLESKNIAEAKPFSPELFSMQTPIARRPWI
jgi:methyl-accepting chemotaxis protein